MTSRAASLSICLGLACGAHRAAAAPDWSLIFSAEAVVNGGSPVYLNPDDKPLCVPTVVRLKLAADQPVLFYVFRVHEASKPLTFMYSSTAPEREHKTEYQVLDYETERPEDGFYIVASERAMEPSALRESARGYGPLRLSPDPIVPVARTTTPFWIWKGNDTFKIPKRVRARNKGGIAVAPFKFKRTNKCELK